MLNCRVGITSPKNITFFRYRGMTFSKVLKLAMMHSAEGTQSMQLMRCSLRYWISLTGKENSALGMICIEAPQRSVA